MSEYTTFLERKNQEEIDKQAAAGPDWAQGCEKCRFGCVDSADSTSSLFKQEDSREYCDCPAGQARAAMSNRDYQQADIMTEQRKLNTLRRIEELFGSVGVPPQWAGYTTKAYADIVAGDTEKQKFVEALRRFFREYPQKGYIDTNDGPRYGICAYGNAGTGKTGGMTPMFGKLVADGEIGLWVSYLDMLRLCRDFDSGMVAERIHKLQTVPVLFLDELGNPNANATEYERDDVVFSVLKARHEAQRVTFITSNLLPPAMSVAYGERVYRRVFELCAGVNVGGPRIGGDVVTDIDF